MAGRGDNNKHGSAGRGASNQSNQPFINDGEDQPKSNHNKNQTGGKPSVKQKKTVDTDADRNQAVTKERLSPIRTDERNFDLLVDGVPYLVKATPFSFNGEARFYISINGDGEHVFTWDSEIGGLRAIDDSASILPDGLEEAISEKLQSQEK
jgi:hypothetical protein